MAADRVYLDIPHFFSISSPWIRALNWWGRLEGGLSSTVYSLPLAVYESMMGRGDPQFALRANHPTAFMVCRNST